MYGWSRHVPAMAYVPDIVFRMIAYIFQTNDPSGVGPPALFLQSDLFTHLRLRGIPVILMGVNDEHTLIQAISSGGSCVLSDRLRIIKEYLDKHPELKFIPVH